jgi:hypothetical protein
VCVDLWKPRIVWLSGPHDAAKQDISVFIEEPKMRMMTETNAIEMHFFGS